MRPRFALLLSLVWLACAGARAEVVVLACAEECTAAQFQGLELELRGYGAILSARPAPAGFTPAARGADAQRTNELLAAEVTLWVEHEQPLRVCAYSRRGGSLHEAPLPAPHARVQVQGTVFSVQVGDSRTTVQVHEGAVQVAGRVLRAGQDWSSSSTNSRFDHALFATEVRAALAARKVAPAPSEPPRHVESLAPTSTPPPTLAQEAPVPAARRVEARGSAREQNTDVAPRPAPLPRRQVTPEALPPPLTPEAAELMLREGRTEALLSLLTEHRDESTYARVYADALRASGDFERAVAAYEALAEQSSGSLRGQAGYAAAQLALGPLHDALRALRAIEHFDLTAPGSPLGERASVLHIDALVALGRSAEARAAAHVYLVREPDNETSARLRKLLESPRP
jgi:hypothetical protein